MDDDAATDWPQTAHWEVVRIYFNRLHSSGRRSAFWKCVVRPPAAVSLAKEALNEGIVFAVVTLGAAGFVRGAKRVETNMGETVSETLPSCLELVGPTGQIRSFLEARKAVLADAIVMRMEGSLMLTTRQDT
jgi:PII-like signaling protein